MANELASVPDHARARVAAFAIGLVLACVALVALPLVHHPGRRQTYLHLLAGDDSTSGAPSLALRAEVRQHPAVVLAAGYRACAWAAAHPDLPRDNTLRTAYDRTTKAPSFAANTQGIDTSGLIAQTAWDHLCPLHFVGSDD